MKKMDNIDCSSIEHLMVDALFGDLDAEKEQQLSSHLNEHPECAQLFAEMKSTLEVTKKVPEVLPKEPYWSGFQQRLNDRITAEQQQKARIDLKEWGMALRRLFAPTGHSRFALPYQLGLATVLVVIGVLIGRFGLSGSSTTPSLTTNVDSTAIKAMQVAEQTESYLNRSSILLLGLVNHDTESEGLTIPNFDRKREAANTLVDDAAILKASLKRSEEAQLYMLIEELEKVLLQIANLEMQEDVPGIEMIQEGIEGRALLLKINLETMKRMEVPPSEPSNELSL